MATLSNSQLSAGLYSAFWDRAPDATGQNFWVGKLNGGMPLLQVATEFYNAPEGLAAYPNWLRNDPVALIKQAYLSVFERPADDAGLAFYTKQMAAGATFPQVVINMMTNAVNSAAAGNTDGMQFVNEIAVGVYVAETLRTNDPAITSIALQGVTYEPSSVVIREAQLAQMAATVYTLTTSADNVPGSELNSVVNGALSTNGQQTFQSWDTIDGGSGIDTLNATLTGTVTSPTLANIDFANFQDGYASGSLNTVNLSGLSSLSGLTLLGTGGNNTGSGFTINNIGSVPNVTIQGTGGNNTLNFDAAALIGANTLNLTLEDVGNAVATNTAGSLTLSRNVSGALETINLVSNGTANVLGTSTTSGLIASGLGATTLNIAGSTNITLNGITDTGNTLKTINASNLLGNLSVTALSSSTVTGGAGNDTITTNGGGQNSITGGLGNDTFVFGNVTAGVSTNVLNTNDTIIGGLGTDALSVVVAAVNAGTVYTNISGVETINLLDALANTVTLANTQAGLQTVNLRAAAASGNAGTIVFDGTLTPSAYTVNIGNNATSGSVQSTLNGALTVQVAGTGTADAVTINGLTYQAVGTNANNAFGNQNINANGVETLTLSTSQTVQGGTATALAQQVNAITITPTAGTSTTLNISGNNSLTAGVITANAINASGLVANVNGTASALTMTAGANTATSILGSAGRDTLIANQNSSSAIDGGAGNDTITGGVGNDTLIGGAGNDQITINNGTGRVSVDAGIGSDTVVVSATAALVSTDTITGGDGTDILRLVQSGAVTASNAAGVSGFEYLDFQGTANTVQDLSVFQTNNTLTRIYVDNFASPVTLNNASSTITTLALVGANSTAAGFLGSAANQLTFNRAVDVTTSALTIQNVDGSDLSGANAITALTTNNERTLTVNTTGVVPATGATQDGNITITTLNDTNLKTLNVSGGANVALTTIAGATQLATVNATSLTGAFLANASSSTVNLSLTSGTGATTFTSGTGNDNLLGGTAADSLNGGSGADTINAGSGADTIVGSTGADVLTGGSAADQFVQRMNESVAATATAFAGGTVAAGDTMTFANGVDQVTDFVAGISGDTFGNSVGAAVPNSLIGTNQLAEANGIYYASGTWNAAAGRFTVAANGAGPDTMIVQVVNGAGANLTTNASATILVGVTSSNLVANNFVLAGGATTITGTWNAGAFTVASTQQIQGTVTITAAGVITTTDPNATVTQPQGFVQANLTSANLSGLSSTGGTTSSYDGTVSTLLNSVTGTASNDNFIFATAAFGNANSTVTGGTGTDTLTFTTFGTATLNSAQAAGQNIAGIENISLTAGATALTLGASVTVANNGSVVAVTNAGAANTSNVNLGTGAAHTFTSGSTGADTVTLGLAGQTATFTDAAVNNVIAGAVSGSTVIANNAGGNTVSITNGAVATNYDSLAANYTGGAGADTLVVTNGLTATGNTVTTGTLTGIETLAVGAVGAVATTTFNIGAGSTGLTTLTATTANNQNATFNLSLAQLAALTTLTVGGGGAGTFTVGMTTTAGGTATLALTNAAMTNVDTVTFANATSAVNITAASDVVANPTVGFTGSLATTDSLTLSSAVGAANLDRVTAFETITLAAAAGNTVTAVDALVAAGATLVVNETGAANAFTWNGAAETNGFFNITGTSAGDTITGGALADTIVSGGGADFITGGNGADQITLGAGVQTLLYTNAIQSTGGTADTLINYDFNNDIMQLSTAMTGTTFNVNAAVGNSGYNNYAAGNLQVATDQGTLSVNFTTPANAPAAGNLNGLATLAYNVTGTVGNDAITTGAGNDTINAGAGNDTINAGAGNNSIDGQTGADVMTGGAGVDTYGTANDFGQSGQSVVASANTLAANIAATNTITFATGAAGTVDRITNFTSGVDKLDVVTAATAPTTLIGVGSAAGLTNNTTYVAYGNYNAGTGAFTIAAGYAAGTADAIVYVGNGVETAVNATGYVVLTGLNQALVAGDFI